MKKSAFIIAAIAFAACTNPTEKAVKDYLTNNSNDGKIEIVEMSEPEDYTFDYDPAWLLKEAFKAAVSEAEFRESLYNVAHEKEEMDAWRNAINKADSLQAIIDTIQMEHYPMKRVNVSYRGKNALGVEVLERATLFVSNDNGKVSTKPNEVI